MKDALLAAAFLSLIFCPLVINRLSSATHASRRDGMEAKRIA